MLFGLKLLPSHNTEANIVFRQSVEYSVQCLSEGGYGSRKVCGARAMMVLVFVIVVGNSYC